MYQVYNVDDTMSFELSHLPSLADLKTTCIVMHERRRQVLCALLAIQVEPYDPAWTTWRTVIRELTSLTRLLYELTNGLARALEDEQRSSLS